MNGREGIGVSKPLRFEYPGAFYHVTSRGKERRYSKATGIEKNIYLILNRLMSDMSRRFAGAIKRSQDLRKALSKIEKEDLLNVAI